MGDAFITKLTPDGSAMLYSFCLGGFIDDRAFGVTVDAQGTAYLTGSADSADFPVVNPLQPKEMGADA